MRPEHVTRTPTNGGALFLSPSLLRGHWREFWSRDTNVYLRYKRFGVILTQFYVNFSRQEHQIDVLYASINS